MSETTSDDTLENWISAQIPECAKNNLANQHFFQILLYNMKKIENSRKEVSTRDGSIDLNLSPFSFLGTGVIKTVKTGYLLHFKSKWIFCMLHYHFAFEITWNRKLSFHVWPLLLGAYPMIAIKKKFGSKILFTFFYYMVQLCAIYNFR